jgi:hypothetical protein
MKQSPSANHFNPSLLDNYFGLLSLINSLTWQRIMVMNTFMIQTMRMITNCIVNKDLSIKELFGITMPCQSFQKYIDDGTLIPGWHRGQFFLLCWDFSLCFWLLICMVLSYLVQSQKLYIPKIQSTNLQGPEALLWS